MEQKKDRMKEETDKPTIIVGYFNISLSTTDRTNRQKVSQNIEDLDDFTNQFDLIDIYRTFHPTWQNTHSFQLPKENSRV